MGLTFIGIFGILANFVLAAGVIILYRRTGHSIGVALFTGFLSLTPILIFPAITLGFFPTAEFVAFSTIVSLIPPCLVLFIALKKWPKFEHQEILKDVF